MRHDLIETAVALPVFGTYTYSVPEGLKYSVSPGKRLLVPFGNRKITAYAIGVATKPEDAKKIKSIIEVLDEEPLFPTSMIPFFQWVADYYIHPLGEVLRTALPEGVNLFDYTFLTLTDKGNNSLDDVPELLKKGPVKLQNALKKIPRSKISVLEKKGLVKIEKILSQASAKPKTAMFATAQKGHTHSVQKLSKKGTLILETLLDKGEIETADLNRIVKNSSGPLKTLVKKGLVKIFEKEVYRDPFGEGIEMDTVPVLSDEQNNAVVRVIERMDKGYSPFLLHGVTGSGKTEVYKRLVQNALDAGRTALVLVPEIALISEIGRLFRSRFGEKVALLHSGLSRGERFDQWMRIVKGEAPLVIGARSAVFAPLRNIGIIIVDEEHDSSYKQEGGLHYNARDLAAVRASFEKCPVVFGSATPSTQSYHNVKTGKYSVSNLRKRVAARSLPDVIVVDLKKYKDRKGIKRFFTPELIRALEKALANKEQILLFLNRRGFANTPVCAVCGASLKCKNCEVPLTLHKSSNAYMCHYCGFTAPPTATCQTCGSSSLMLLGAGTEKIEEAAAKFFPEARIARMDRDTTTKKGSIIKMLKDLKDRKIDILVGTQMITKGLDFPNITIVGIICADLSLSFPDFRAGERTFQLLSQVAGRAGRGDIPGTVFLQTYNPEHYSIKTARDQDFYAFYKEESVFRRALDYPPYSKMVLIKISGKDKDITKARGEMLFEAIHELQQNSPESYANIMVMGPIEAPIARIAGKYRMQIVLKGHRINRMRELYIELMNSNKKIFARNDVKIIIDIDPYMMM